MRSNENDLMNQLNLSTKENSDLVRSLINLIEEPVLAFNQQSGKILFVNSPFLHFSRYSESEIIDKEFQEFLLEIDNEQILPGAEIEGKILKRKSNTETVTFSCYMLDSSGTYLIKIRPDEHDEKFSEEDTLSFLLDLVKLSFEMNLKSLVSKVIKYLRQLLNAPYVMLYHAKSGSPEFIKIATTEEKKAFPNTIDSTELMALIENSNWIPGRHVRTNVHRAGRVSGLSHVVAVPLGSEESTFGLVVIGAHHLIHKKFLKNIELVCSFVSFVMQEFIFRENIAKKEQKNLISNLSKDIMFENADQGVIILQVDTKIAGINPAAELQLGYSRREVINSSVEDILVGAEEISVALEAAQRGIATYDMGEIYLHKRTGESFPVDLQIVPVIKNSQVYSILILIKDITFQVNTRTRTRHLEQRAVIGDFTGIFAHEVRNPINNISTGLQVIKSQLDENDSKLKTINRMLDDCARLDNLMESVLAYSRPMEPKFKLVDIGSLIRLILDRWRPRLDRYRVELVFKNESTNMMALGDHRMLEQIFTNLISNAAKVMKETGGTLAVRITENDGIENHPQIQVDVSDTGPGIPEEIKDEIFKPFVSKDPQGTGLGLAITKHMVTAHRGTIDVESFPGATMFKVVLPARAGGTE